VSIDPQISYIQGILDYDRNTGVFTWRHRAGKMPKGSVAGSKTKAGYLQNNFSDKHSAITRKHWQSHILAFSYVTGRTPKPGYEVHHKNGDPTDNRFENLEEIEASEHASIKRTKALTPREQMVQRLKRASHELRAASSSLAHSIRLYNQLEVETWGSELASLRECIASARQRTETLLAAAATF